jgi:hypothetical protein
MSKTSINPPEWNFPPMIMSPTPKKKTPSKRQSPNRSPHASPFDFESNIAYSSAQLRTPLGPIYLSQEDKEILRQLDKELVKLKPTKRKLIYPIPKKSSPKNQTINDDYEYASTQIITPKKTPKKKKRIILGSMPSDDDESLPPTQF